MTKQETQNSGRLETALGLALLLAAPSSMILGNLYTTHTTLRDRGAITSVVTPDAASYGGSRSSESGALILSYNRNPHLLSPVIDASLNGGCYAIGTEPLEGMVGGTGRINLEYNHRTGSVDVVMLDTGSSAQVLERKPIGDFDDSDVVVGRFLDKKQYTRTCSKAVTVGTDS